MIDRRTWWRIGAAGAVPVAMLAGFLWHSGFEPEYVAYARISVPTSIVTAVAGPQGSLTPTIEEVILSPENMTAAADLVRLRGIILSTVSPLDSDVEELIRRVDAGHDQQHDHAEVRVSFQTPDADQAIPVLSAVLDACLAALDHANPRGDETAATSREAELNDLTDELATRQDALADLEQRARRFDASQLDATLLADRIRSLESSLAKARDERIAAEDRLADIHQQLGAGFTAEQIAEKLPGSLHSGTHEQVVTTRAKEELRQQQESLDKASTIYGRNHPRLIQIRNEVDRLKQQAGIVHADASSESAPRSPSSVLLQSQEALLNQASISEQELETQLERAVSDRKSRIELDEQLALARDEIGPLRGRYDELKRQTDAADRAAESGKATICEPPALAPEAIVPSLTGYLAWGGFVGLIFAAGFWHKSRPAPRAQPTPILLAGPKLPVVIDWGKPVSKPATPTKPATAPPTAIAAPLEQKPDPELTVTASVDRHESDSEPPSEPSSSSDSVVENSPSDEESETPVRPRERFRSQEEENLARLKRLSMQTA